MSDSDHPCGCDESIRLAEIIDQLVNAVQLILAIDMMPDDENPEIVHLCPGSRNQLRQAVIRAGSEPISLTNRYPKGKQP